MNRLAVKLDLGTVSVDKLVGLTQEDRDELKGLHIGSVKLLMEAIDATDGDLESVSTPAIVLDPDQVDRILASLLAYDQIPDTWKKKWQQPTAASQTETAMAEVIAPEEHKQGLHWEVDQSGGKTLWNGDKPTIFRWA